MPLRRTGRVQFHVQAIGFGEVSGLERAGDALVVFGVGAQEVGRPLLHPRHLGLERADMLGQQQRRPQPLAEAPVRGRRGAHVLERVLVPEAARLVAGEAEMERIGEGAERAGRIDHQRHVGPDRVAHGQQVRRLLARIALAPAMDLEAPEALRPAGERELGKGLLRGQHAIPVGMHRAGIGRQPVAIPAQHARDRLADRLAGEVPQADIDRRQPDCAEMPL